MANKQSPKAATTMTKATASAQSSGLTIRPLRATLNYLWANPNCGESGRTNYPIWRNMLVLLLTFLAVLGVYYFTSAPTIVTEGDAAEFTAAGKLGGIAHPPGYPGFILICWLISKIVPALSLARALNLLSVFSGALACTAIAAIVITIIRRWSPSTKPLLCYSAAIVAATSTALSLETWTQALSCEVYTLSLAIIFGSILLSIHEFGEKYPQVMLFMLAFGYGIHHTIIVLSIPIIAEFFFRTRLNLRGRWLETFLVFGGVPIFLIGKKIIDITSFSMTERILGLTICLTLFAVISWLFKKHGGYRGSIKEIITCWLAWLTGLAVYLYLPLRSATQPNMDFVNPETYKGFWDLITMAGMPSLNPAGRDWTIWQAQFASFFHQYGRQYPAFVYPFTAVGLLALLFSPFLVCKNKDKIIPGPWTLHMVLLAIFLGTTWGYIAITNFQPGTSFENEVRVFYLPGYAVGTLVIAFSWLLLCQFLAQKFNTKVVSTAIIFFTTLWLSGAGYWLGSNWHSQDKSNNYIAYNYGLDLLSSVEPNALIFTPGDNAAQPIFYFQQVEKRYLNVAAVHIPLIGFPWYKDMLKRIYPTLNVPRQARSVIDIIRANYDWRPIYLARAMDLKQLPGYRLQPIGFLYRIVKQGSPDFQKSFDLQRLNHLISYPQIAMDLREQSMYAEYRDALLKQGLYLQEHNQLDLAISYLEFAYNLPPVSFNGDQMVRAYTVLVLAQTYTKAGRQKEALTIATTFLQERPDFLPLKQWLDRFTH